MKFWLGFIGSGLLFAGAIAPARRTEVTTVIISGNANGHLAPCGCTKPMSGGMSRLAGLVRRYRESGPVVWIDTGNTVDSADRQSQLKLEAYAEMMGKLEIDVVHFGVRDALLGSSGLYAGANLTGKPWLMAANQEGVATDRQLVAGLSIRASEDEAADISITDSNRSKIHTEHSQLQVYRSDGTPRVEGNLVTPGSRLRGVVIARFEGKKFLGASTVSLSSSMPGDPDADEAMKSYNSRVKSERLIDKVLKSSQAAYAGSGACVSCHSKAAKVHAKSKHAVAYQTLVKDGHEADPDCVSCHVVGMESSRGFRYGQGKKFAEVGCESCHGPGAAHASKPKVVRMRKVGEKPCLSCHTSTTSPGFNFLTFWKRIRH